MNINSINHKVSAFHKNNLSPWQTAFKNSNNLPNNSTDPSNGGRNILSSVPAKLFLLAAAAGAAFLEGKKLFKSAGKLVGEKVTKGKPHPFAGRPWYKETVEEMKKLHTRNSEIIHKAYTPEKGLSDDLLNLQYYKDEFRLNFTIPADNLKIVRESADPKIRALFDPEQAAFGVSEGAMIYGKNEVEKTKLFNHFITEAEKHGIDVIRLPNGDFKHLETSLGEFKPRNETQDLYDKLTGAIIKFFPKAKERFKNDRIQTMFVIENVDNLLNITNPKFSGPNSILRARFNEYTHKCGYDGTCWLTTAKSIDHMDPSCIRGGRLKYRINIDKAVNAVSE